MAAESWRLFPTLSAPMPLQMTLDRLLFEKHRSEIQPPLFRFFYSSAPWVSVGYAAEKKSGYSLAASGHKLDGVPVCRRITGGGTVVHGQDLIFSIFARRQDCPDKFDSVETSYRHIHEAVRRGFAKLGQEADFYKKEESLSGRDCFIFPVCTDLKISGRKVAGGAQKRSEDVFLHQESVQPPSGVDLLELEKAVREAMEEYFGFTARRITVNPQLLSEAESQSENCVIKREGQHVG